MNSIGTVALTLFVLLVLCAPRRVALLGMMAGALYLTQGQQVSVLGLNLFPTRFLELAGFIRVMARGEFSFCQWNRIDGALLLLYGYTTGIFMVRSTDGLAYQIGVAVDACLAYFTFRGLMGDLEDFRWFLRAFIFLLAPYTLLVVIESVTGHNPFALVGGITGGSTWIRHGRPRCFGSFRQPDTLGMFAASFLPLYVGAVFVIRERSAALFGICLCLILAWAANSGGAAAATAAGLGCWWVWRFRTKMRKVRWGILVVLALVAVVMRAPLWYIFARVSSVTGGDGWHRSYLFDVAYQHLGKWWLAGMPISETRDWFPYNLGATGAADITSQYIAFGIDAGVAAIALFVLLLTRAFSSLGRALATARFSYQQTSDSESLLWGLGIMLVVHVIDWFGMTYFDQMYAVWFMQLAAVSSLSQNREDALALPSSSSVEVDSEIDQRASFVLDGRD